MRRKQSPKIGILGNSTFSTDAGMSTRKLESVPANTVNSVIKNIEEQVVLGFEQLALFKKEAEILRQETDKLMNELMERVENVDDDIKPETYKDYKTLKANIKAQKEENTVLDKELVKVATETAEQREKVKIYEERILAMEEVVGMIANNEIYQNNHLPGAGRANDDKHDDLYEDSKQENSKVIDCLADDGLQA